MKSTSRCRRGFGRLLLPAALALSALAALVMSSGQVAHAQPATLVLATSPTFVPLGGFRNSAVTLAANVSASDTIIPISDQSLLKPGLVIEIPTELMLINSLTEGNPDTMHVTRGYNGTTAASHSAGAVIYANFEWMNMQVSGVTYLSSGANLVQGIDSGALEDSGAVISSAVGTEGFGDSGVTAVSAVGTSQTTISISDQGPLKPGQVIGMGTEVMLINSLSVGNPDTMNVTRGYNGTTATSHSAGTHITIYTNFEWINVSDAKLLEGASTVRFDGASYVSVANGPFLGSTGRSVNCAYGPYVLGNSVGFGCATLGATPNGPNGNGVLAEVHLKADHLGTISLNLLNYPVDTYLLTRPGSQIPISQILGASVTVVTSPQTPPTVPTTCNTGVTALCVQPASQTVELGSEVVLKIVAEGVTDLGGYQFTLGWDPATEEMAVQDLRRGYLNEAGQLWYRGVTLTAAIDNTVTTVPVNDGTSLQPGWTALVGSEEMLIVGVTSNTMSVVRGYNGTTRTSHSSGASVYAGPERMKVQRNASTAAPHAAGSDFRANLRVLHVNDHNLLVGDLALQIGNERFKVTEVPARTLRETGTSLSQAADASQTQLQVGDSSQLQVGWLLLIDNERMPVTEITGPSSVRVVRGFFGTQASSHALHALIWAGSPEPNTVKVSRGLDGTALESHDAGSPITDLDGLGSYSFTLTRTSAAIDFVSAKNGAFLGSTGRVPQCAPPSLGAGTVSLLCDSSGELRGPTGSGNLAAVSVFANTFGSSSVSFTAADLEDVSGDVIAETTQDTLVKVVKCPDVDGSIAATITDVIIVARAALVAGYPQLPEYDIDDSGRITISDVLAAAKMVLNGGSLRCPL